MRAWQVLPYAVAALELGASAVYGWHQDWRLMVVWGGYGLAALAFAGIT